jgi:DNA polymerase IV
MPAIRAERLCPAAVFVPPDFPRYREVSRKVRDIFQRHTDLIEPLSLDEAYLDVTENKTGLPTATLVARTIREQIRQDVAHRQMVAVHARQFPAAQRARHQHREQSPVPHSANAVRIRRLQ